MLSATDIVNRLCSVEGDRRPGSRGNADAVALVSELMASAGWAVDVPAFPCLDWVGRSGCVEFPEGTVDIVPSPYGLGVDHAGPLHVVHERRQLEDRRLRGSVLVVTGEMAARPLTPKRYPFYESEDDAWVIAALEAAEPIAVVAVTGRHPELCGALDPFPWIEDGDFAIPVASVRPEDAAPLLGAHGAHVRVVIDAQRIPASAANVVARRGPEGPRLTIAAHIDTKPGTPGAVDNGASVAALVSIAHLLGSHEPPVGVELLAVNGEDHFAAPGERAWLAANEGALDDVQLFINLDGVAYRHGRTAYSFYNVEEGRAASLRSLFSAFDQLVEGPPWFQSDHAIFATQGRPALAMTTEFVDEMLAELFHAPSDTPDQVEPARIREAASALERVVMTW